MFPLVRVFGVAVGNYHFSKGKSIEDASLIAFVVVRDIVQDDPFAVVESDMDFPVFPLDNPAIDLEIDAFRLCDINRLDVLPVPAFGFNCCRVIVVW